MRYVAATAAGTLIGLAITAGLSHVLARCGDTLADLNGDPSAPRTSGAGHHRMARYRTHG